MGDKRIEERLTQKSMNESDSDSKLNYTKLPRQNAKVLSYEKNTQSSYEAHVKLMNTLVNAFQSYPERLWKYSKYPDSKAERVTCMWNLLPQ